MVQSGKLFTSGGEHTYGISIASSAGIIGSQNSPCKDETWLLRPRSIKWILVNGDSEALGMNLLRAAFVSITTVQEEPVGPQVHLFPNGTND